MSDLLRKIESVYLAGGGRESREWVKNMGLTEEELQQFARDVLVPAFAGTLGDGGVIGAVAAAWLSGLRVGYILGVEEGMGR